MKYYSLHTDEYQPETLILAKGGLPKNPFLLQWLQKGRYVVCCDGAVNDYIQLGRKPTAIVGDCDSLSAEMKQMYADILYYEKDQETNDLTKSIRYCMSQGREDIAIVGATGKREDHTLGNISLLADYMNDVQVEMFTDYGVFTPINQPATFQSFAGQQVSFFCMDPAPLTLEGMKYPVNNRVMSRWWQGTLNESLSDKFAVYPSGKVIVFRVFNS